MTFFLIKLAPGGPFDAEKAVSPQGLKNLNAVYNLDASEWEQYTDYMTGVIQGDFGPSFKYPGRSVTEMIASGLPITFELAMYATKNNLGPAAFFSGIPGSIGGALTMNAGCFGSETWEFVKSVEVIDRNGEIYHLDPKEFSISYRSVSFPFPLWFLSCDMVFPDRGVTTVEELKILRDSRLERIWDGTSEIQKHIITRSILRPLGG